MVTPWISPLNVAPCGPTLITCPPLCSRCPSLGPTVTLELHQLRLGPAPGPGQELQHQAAEADTRGGERTASGYLVEVVLLIFCNSQKYDLINNLSTYNEHDSTITAYIYIIRVVRFRHFIQLVRPFQKFSLESLKQGNCQS